MSRRPYTHSCDFIREYVGPSVSRSEASQLRAAIADVLGMTDFDLAEALSLAFIDKNGLEE
jgi:hypothetical protein